MREQPQSSIPATSSPPKMDRMSRWGPEMKGNFERVNTAGVYFEDSTLWHPPLSKSTALAAGEMRFSMLILNQTWVPQVPGFETWEPRCVSVRFHSVTDLASSLGVRMR